MKKSKLSLVIAALLASVMTLVSCGGAATTAAGETTKAAETTAAAAETTPVCPTISEEQFGQMKNQARHLLLAPLFIGPCGNPQSPKVKSLKKPLMHLQLKLAFL